LDAGDAVLTEGDLACLAEIDQQTDLAKELRHREAGMWTEKDNRAVDHEVVAYPTLEDLDGIRADLELVFGVGIGGAGA
jgi:hypothetical protein